MNPDRLRANGRWSWQAIFGTRRLRRRAYLTHLQLNIRRLVAIRISTVPAYKENFPIGSQVRIADIAELERFRATWRLHNPLAPEQLAWASHRAKVAEVGFYHGGDPLYVLEAIPGVWHEQCLTAISDRAT